MNEPQQQPIRLDVTTPHVARIYDHLLDGKDNYEADREAAAKLMETRPDVRRMAQANRRFLVRAVEYLAEAGIRQFIDLGTGIPTSPNVHEVASAIQPGCRIVYVDNDPVVTIHNQALSVKGDNAAAIEADIREPDRILEHPMTQELIDFTDPVAVLFIAVLHFIPDADDPYSIVSAFRDRMAPGSYIAISVATTEGLSPQNSAELVHTYKSATSTATLRSREQIMRFLHGFEMIEPGLVGVSRWRALGSNVPEPLAAVARKP